MGDYGRSLCFWEMVNTDDYICEWASALVRRGRGGPGLGGVFVANERLCCTFSSANARCCSRSLTEKTNPGSEGKDWSGVRGSLGSWPTWGRRSPEWIRKSQNTQSPRLRFRALLTEGGDLSVQLHRT